LTTHGTSYLGLIMRLGGVYETRGDSLPVHLTKPHVSALETAIKARREKETGNTNDAPKPKDD
ncbi:hypothetical protein, partial [Pseudomonas qingdaonensis]|uniref:hypothetical protein n=1 Tax=Pseudomonas qingdaonensis TaxID=2056231 RepID=UPI002E172394|nr:hypothetical protein [Pseudomonas qingdaonensis]